MVERGEKQGCRPRRCCRQVSVSPQGFPSEKNRLFEAVSSFVPLFTGQLFIVGEGFPAEDSRKATGKLVVGWCGGFGIRSVAPRIEGRMPHPGPHRRMIFCRVPWLPTFAKKPAAT